PLGSDVGGIVKWNGTAWVAAASNSLRFSMSGQGWYEHGFPVRLFALPIGVAGLPAPTLFAVQEIFTGTPGGQTYGGAVYRLDGSQWVGVGSSSGVVYDMILFDPDGAGPEPQAVHAATTWCGSGCWYAVLRLDGQTWTTVAGGPNTNGS